MSLLPLPISPLDCRIKIIEPAMQYMPAKLRGRDAQILLLAIALQETKLAARKQYGNGPANGLLQNERGGMVRGVITSHATSDMAKTLCAQFSVPFDELSVWTALELNDEFAFCWARLGLWAEPSPLPTIGDVVGNWTYYRWKVWRPGKPHQETWAENYAAALEAYQG